MRALEMRGVVYGVYAGDRFIEILRGVSLVVEKGRVVGLIGPSGSGKTTVLRVAYMELVPVSGELFVLGERVTWGLRQVSRLRRRIGFVPQENILLEELSVLENTVLPLILRGYGYAESVERARRLLGELGLLDKAEEYPGRLSFGEKRRVVVAQSIIYEPELLLADEPTNGLDDASARRVMGVIRGLGEKGSGVLVASHDPVVQEGVDELVVIRGGVVVSQGSRRRLGGGSSASS